MRTLLILLFTFSTASAQWKQMPGPYGAADINGFASANTNLFVAVGGDIYRSVDSGTTWSRAAHWPHALYSFFCHDTTLFVISSDGAYRSRDLGANWDSLTNPHYQGTTIYTTPRGLFTWSGTGLRFDTLMFSSDEGTTWQFQPVPWMQYPGSVVTAGTVTLKIDDYGVSRSTDSGKTWIASLLDSIAKSNCLLLFAKDKIVLAVMNWGGGGEVYRSTDAGIAWQQTGLRFPEDKNIDYTGGFQTIGNLIYIADGSSNKVYMSSDSGHSWHVRYNSYNPQSSLFAFGDNLYLGGGYSKVWHDLSYFIYRSRDSAKSWSLANTGLPNISVNALAANSNTLFAAVDEGLESSTDDGQTWTIARYLPDKEPYWLVAKDSVVIVGGGGLHSGSERTPKDTLFSSTDNGVSFYRNDLSESVNYGTAILDTTVVVATNPGMLVSFDQGRNFVILDSAFQYVYDPVIVGNKIFVRRQYGEVYVTSDLGRSWTESLADTSSYGPLLCSINGLLFISIPYRGVQRSTDTGRSWQQLTALSDRVEIWATASASGYLFASLYALDSIEQHSYGLISMSSDDGAHWYPLPIEYPDAAGRPNTLLAHDGYLFAGGPNGLWRLPLIQILQSSGVVQHPRIVLAPSVFITPNPTRNTFTVTFANTQGAVHYEIADALGRTMNAGETTQRTLAFSAATMPTGIYTLRTDANGLVCSRTFVVIK